MRDYILLIRTNRTGNSTAICVTTSVIAFDQNEILDRTKKNKTALFDGITSVRAWTIIPHNARVFVYHAALWQAVVVVCAQMDTVDRKTMQIHRDELSYFNFRYVSVLIFPSFHIKYASENSCRRCVSLLESLEQRRRSNVAQSQTTLPSTYPSRKHKKPETNETTFETLQAFKTTTPFTCTAFKKNFFYDPFANHVSNQWLGEFIKLPKSCDLIKWDFVKCNRCFWKIQWSLLGFDDFCEPTNHGFYLISDQFYTLVDIWMTHLCNKIRDVVISLLLAWLTKLSMKHTKQALQINK